MTYTPRNANRGATEQDSALAYVQPLYDTSEQMRFNYETRLRVKMRTWEVGGVENMDNYSLWFYAHSSAACMSRIPFCRKRKPNQRLESRARSNEIR